MALPVPDIVRFSYIVPQRHKVFAIGQSKVQEFNLKEAKWRVAGPGIDYLKEVEWNFNV